MGLTHPSLAQFFDFSRDQASISNPAGVPLYGYCILTSDLIMGFLSAQSSSRRRLEAEFMLQSKTSWVSKALGIHIGILTLVEKVSFISLSRKYVCHQAFITTDVIVKFS